MRRRAAVSLAKRRIAGIIEEALRARLGTDLRLESVGAPASMIPGRSRY